MKRVLNWFKRERFVLLGLFLFGFSVVFSVLCFIFNRLPEGLIIIGSVVGILTLNTIYFSIDTTPVLPQITQVDGVGSIIATMLFTDNTSGFYGSLTGQFNHTKYLFFWKQNDYEKLILKRQAFKLYKAAKMSLAQAISPVF